MTQLPDFTRIDFKDVLGDGDMPSADAWTTPEGIAVKPVYTAADTAGLDFLDTYPGLAPVSYTHLRAHETERTISYAVFWL